MNLEQFNQNCGRRRSAGFSPLQRDIVWQRWSGVNAAPPNDFAAGLQMRPRQFWKRSNAANALRPLNTTKRQGRKEITLRSLMKELINGRKPASQTVCRGWL